MAALSDILRRMPALAAVLLVALLLRLSLRRGRIRYQPAPPKEYQVKAIFLFNFALSSSTGRRMHSQTRSNRS